MRTTLTRIGDELTLVIDRALLDQIGIGADTLLDVRVDGQSIVITPVEETPRDRLLREAMEEAHRRYGRVFKRLAE
jgi:antitoxin component of MazEF toxin-antitoxin module